MKDRIHIIRNSNALALELWHQLSSSDPHARFTQSPIWVRLGVEELHWKAVCIVWSGERVVLPLIVTSERFGKPVRIESMPWGMTGGPLVDPSFTSEVPVGFGKDLSRLAPEIILYPSGRITLPGWETIPHSIHEVELPTDNPGSWVFAHRKCRTAARHALKKGVTIKRIRNGSDLQRIIRMYRAQQRSRNARTYPDSWWSKLLSEAESNCGLWGAFHNGDVIAGLLLGWWNNHAIALVSTSDPCSRPLKAGNLLYLRVFEHLGNNGICSVDLGGSRGKKSLEAFKESLGGQPKTRCWYRHRNRLYRMYQTVTGIRRV